jgi:hypothetical protein
MRLLKATALVGFIALTLLALPANQSAAAEAEGRPIELMPLPAPSASIPAGPVPTYKANASLTKMLPEEMYGTWGIASILLSTDAPPDTFPPILHHIWTLEVQNGAVILQNPASHAITQVNVEEAKGNTATFHHTANSDSGRVQVRETVTLTVNGDKVDGVERAEYMLIRNGMVRKTYILNLKIEGTRLAGAKVNFHQVDRPENYFEIEPMRRE